jgi:hypothetical protein
VIVKWVGGFGGVFDAEFLGLEQEYVAAVNFAEATPSLNYTVA